MNERIDHAAEARDLTDRGVKASTSDAESRCVAMAQVHATLALVEQQRIANLIALMRVEVENESTPTDALDAIYAREPLGDMTVLHTRPEIAAALGIETGEER